MAFDHTSTNYYRGFFKNGCFHNLLVLWLSVRTCWQWAEPKLHSLLSAHRLIGAYFLTTESSKRMCLLTRLYGSPQNIWWTLLTQLPNTNIRWYCCMRGMQGSMCILGTSPKSKTTHIQWNQSILSIIRWASHSPLRYMIHTIFLDCLKDCITIYMLRSNCILLTSLVQAFN